MTFLLYIALPAVYSSTALFKIATFPIKVSQYLGTSSNPEPKTRSQRDDCHFVMFLNDAKIN